MLFSMFLGALIMFIGIHAGWAMCIVQQKRQKVDVIIHDRNKSEVS